MKATLQWLSDFVDINLDVYKLADLLTMSGHEVEAVETLGEGLDKIIVGKIIGVSPHPKNPGLVIARVESGAETVSVVSSAPNIKVGLKTALALPGVTLPGGIVVEKRAFSGVESVGVLLAEDEMGLTADHTGVMELSDTVPVGKSIAEVLNVKDYLLDIGVTPNRADCLSIIGLAREISALTNVPFRPQKITVKEQGPDVNTLTSVQVIDRDLCPRYTARVVSNIVINRSPFWMCLRLKQLGLRDINNVVDITNYVMLEYGQPLHSFDYSLLAGNRIVVKRAAPNETFYTLDAVQRQLDGDILMICDAEKPVAIGGIMGGANSEIQDDTETVLIESAYFHPPSIRRSSKKLNLPTEASFRFERGVDPQGVIDAANRAAQLMHDLADGVIATGIIDVKGQVPQPPKLTIRTPRVNKIMGYEVTTPEVEGYLKRLFIAIDEKKPDSLTVSPPSFRMDLEREIDLVEEVARLVGFEKIPETLPSFDMSYNGPLPIKALTDAISEKMVALGFNEVITYSFIGKDSFDRMGLSDTDPLRSVISLKNPMSEDMAVMRTTLVPGLVKAAVTNVNALNYDLRLYEIARVFYPNKDNLPEEQEHLCALISGKRFPRQWGAPAAEVDFYDIKGIWESVVDKLGLKEIEYSDNTRYPYLDGYQSCSINRGDVPIGYMGKINEDAQKRLDLDRDAYILEVNLSGISGGGQREIAFKSLVRYPSVTRDISLVVTREVKSLDIVETIKSRENRLIKDVVIFDMYIGKQISEGKKSLALTVRYQSDERTLTDEEVNGIHGAVIEGLKQKLGVQIR